MAHATGSPRRLKRLVAEHVGSRVTPMWPPAELVDVRSQHASAVGLSLWHASRRTQVPPPHNVAALESDSTKRLPFTPPDRQGPWERDILPDGKPLKLLILADTSGSIDADGRRAQADFLAAVLQSLTAEDRFNLATCDVDCQWAFEGPRAASPENLQIALDVLAARGSLGWTDLDAAFRAAAKQADDTTHVIYVGDGIVTTGAATLICTRNWAISMAGWGRLKSKSGPIQRSSKPNRRSPKAMLCWPRSGNSRTAGMRPYGTGAALPRSGRSSQPAC